MASKEGIPATSICPNYTILQHPKDQSSYTDQVTSTTVPSLFSFSILILCSFHIHSYSTCICYTIPFSPFFGLPTLSLPIATYKYTYMIYSYLSSNQTMVPCSLSLELLALSCINLTNSLEHIFEIITSNFNNSSLATWLHPVLYMQC